MRRAGTWLSLIVGGVLAAAAVARAEPAEWRIDPAESRIVFEYRSNGEAAEGVFGAFSGQGRFRPEAPGEASFELTIESGSIDLGDAKASAFATSAEWFDSRNHPNIVYELRELAHLEGNRYRAEGRLTLRGRTRPVTTTITLEVGEREARASGTLTVNRKDYGLGVGPMSLFVEIGPEVMVHFDLTAKPAS